MSTPPPKRRANRLAGQTSPYLLQHLYNPVDWRPWGDEALAEARRRDCPIFLSIGYAACHWCHVMERESFENDVVAGLLNEHFVPIKVDREERPDIDEIYMNAVQLMTGQGGWPLSMFLMPDLRPFLGGTYFPPDDRHARPGLISLLGRIHEAWAAQRGDIDRSAERLTAELERIAAGPAATATNSRVGRGEWSRAAAEFARRFEPRWGGFGGAPKFPPDGALLMLLREHASSGESVPLQMAERTLDAMALGGMYDHVGGGFARYSVDERWLVPHFEKMLYNQALLIPAYVDGWRLTEKPLYRRVVEQTAAFVLRELTDEAGGFFSSLDADSEGEEGKFALWTPEQVDAVLGAEEGRFYCELYDVTPAGNFEGRSIPNLLAASLDERAACAGIAERELSDRVDALQAKLLAARRLRVLPATDDKVLTAWNGLMIGALARAHQAFGHGRHLAAARRAAEFVERRLVRDGRLLASHRDGTSQLNAYLDDHAFLARGLVELYEAGFEPFYLERARRLAERMLERFEDKRHGGFFFTSDDHERLLTRNHSLHDGALPAGSAVAVEVLARLAVHLHRNDFREAAERTLSALHPFVSRMPSAYTHLLLAAELIDSPPKEIAIIGPLDDRATQALLSTARAHTRHRIVIQHSPAATDNPELAIVAAKPLLDGQPTAYVCQNYTCLHPTTDPAELARQLASDGSASQK